MTHGMFRTALLFLVTALVTDVDAQLGERMRRLLNGDSLAPPDHDTAYIATYRSRLVLSAVSRYQFSEVDLERPEGELLTYTSNSNEQYGVGLDYKWLSAEMTFNVPVLDRPDPALGTTDSRGFGLGYTGRRLWVRGFWNSTQGYYMEEPDRWLAGRGAGDPPYTRPDLSNDTYLVSVNYALSKKRRFSQNAAIAQMERQKRSAGTWVAGLAGWSNRVAGDSSLLDPALVDTFQLATGFHGVERTMIGATIGYTHTFSFWRKGFIHSSFLVGPAYLHQRIAPSVGAELSGTGTAALSEVKLGAGFNGDRWYAALTTAYYFSSADIGENGVALGTNYGFARFALGIRLGAPGIAVLRKVGL